MLTSTNLQVAILKLIEKVQQDFFGLIFAYYKNLTFQQECVDFLAPLCLQLLALEVISLCRFQIGVTFEIYFHIYSAGGIQKDMPFILFVISSVRPITLI